MSRRAEYTKAPWFIREYINGNGQACCEITCNRNTQIIADIPDYCFYDHEKPNNKANARLIAAAPDGYESGIALLEVVEAAIASGDWKVDGACDPTAAIESMKQFIAKAKGADHEHI